MQSNSRKIRSLVTGGAGFIGSHLCERLIERGNEVVCVDNYYTGAKANIAHLLDNAYFELIRHDVTFPIYIEVDEIYNLACPASPVHYQRDPVQTTKTNVHGAINILGLAKRLKVRVLQASTSEVYGDPFIRRPRTTKGTSTRLGRGRVTTKASDVQRPCSSITTASMDCRSKLRAFSIPTGRA